MASYPADSSRFARWCRPLNILDDVDNKLSPVKINVWASNCAGGLTAAGTIFAWLANHAALLDHVGAVASVIGPYLAGSHVIHQINKRNNN